MHRATHSDAKMFAPSIEIKQELVAKKQGCWQAHEPCRSCFSLRHRFGGALHGC